MFKRKFTVVAQLHEKNNQEIIDYIDNSRGVYAQALRKSTPVTTSCASVRRNS